MILFLDIDGCLACNGSADFIPAALANVRRYVAAGYRVVLHSTVRAIPDRREQADAMFAAAGITVDWCDAAEPSKAKAIAAYLDELYAGDWPDGITVVDDDPIDLRGVTLIRPESRVGWKDCSGAIRPPEL